MALKHAVPLGATLARFVMRVTTVFANGRWF